MHRFAVIAMLALTSSVLMLCVPGALADTILIGEPAVPDIYPWHNG